MKKKRTEEKEKSLSEKSDLSKGLWGQISQLVFQSDSWSTFYTRECLDSSQRDC